MIMTVGWLVIALQLHASISAPGPPRVETSPNGSFLLRSVENVNTKENVVSSRTDFTVYQFDESTNQYNEISRFSRGGIGGKLFINDNGKRIALVLEHGVVVMNRSGSELKVWSLSEFLSEHQQRSMVDLLHRISWWHRGSWRNNDTLELGGPIHEESGRSQGIYIINVQTLELKAQNIPNPTENQYESELSTSLAPSSLTP